MTFMVASVIQFDFRYAKHSREMDEADVQANATLLYVKGYSRVAALYCTVGNLEMVGHLRFFLLNDLDYVSLNSNPWDGNAPSLGNSWEPRQSKMAAVILVNYKMCSSLHYIMLGT